MAERKKKPLNGQPPVEAPSSRLAFWRRATSQTADESKSRLRQHAESFLLAILVALLVRSSVVEAFWVPSGSMLPTIQIGDHLFVNKLAYGFQVDLPFGIVNWELAQWRSVQRDDIVVFTSPVDHSTDLIKRVIAVGGDTVEVQHKHLYINGQEVPDPHASFIEPNVRTNVPRDNFGPVTVPPGKFFVMGDNRDQSYDSRYWGFADQRDVKGKATFIYWSGWKFDRMGHFLR